MASIRLQFPDGQEAREITLRGTRISVGRAPDNTVQIVDRTLSAHHAEFVDRGDHYHLRDKASTNGVFVNGDRVTDFHLRESCRIAFGSFECEFNPDAPAEGSTCESLPTASEVRALGLENAELRTRVALLQEELSALLAARGGNSEDETANANYTQVVAERATLREAQQTSAQELARLRGELAVVQRDRDNLQRAWDAARGDLDAIRHELSAEEPAASAAPAPAVATAWSTISAAPRDVPAATPRAVARPAAAAVPVKPGVSAPGVKAIPRAVPRATPAPPQAKPRASDTQKL